MANIVSLCSSYSLIVIAEYNKKNAITLSIFLNLKFENFLFFPRLPKFSVFAQSTMRNQTQRQIIPASEKAPTCRVSMLP